MINLHGHSEYSSLDGICKVADIPQKAKSLGQSAIALTDHGSLSGLYKFYNACLKYEIKPILGCEFYFSEDVSKPVSQKGIYHLTLLCKNNEGWENLLQLHKESYNHFYYRPRVDFEILRRFAGGLVAMTGCLKGCLSSFIVQNNVDHAIANFNILKNIFKDNLYVEIMDHGLKDEQIANNILRELPAKKVFTNDYHYTNKEDAELQDILMCDQTKSNLNDPKRLKLSDDNGELLKEFYIKGIEDIKCLPEEIETSLEIADKCNTTIVKHNSLLPKIPHYIDIFTNLVYEGLEKRKIDKSDEIYMSRLREEYRIIKDSKLIPYFLTVRDYVKYCKDNNILIGPGRGSVGGSLIAYLLDIHDVNPIRHKLLFSRFYNEGRKKSLPDIDIDFPLNKVDEVLSYIRSKYKYVSKIGTYTSLEIKGALKLVCRVMEIDFSISNKYSQILENPSETKMLYNSDELFKKIYDIALKLIGIVMYSSVHAAGIIISPIDISKIVPTREDTGFPICMWDMHDIEDIGFIKYDILHLNTLDVIQETLKRTNLKISDIPLDDKDAFKLINETKNVGIFQLSSDGICKVANQVKVDSVDDIAVIVALYRPGLINLGMHDAYIRRKIGTEAISYTYPLLESVLKDTYGIMLYQEQITEICQKLAGFTETEADLLRKAIGKKIPELMRSQKEPFIKGCVNNNISENIADTIWEQIVEFSGYAFNRAHSTEYGCITLYTAYLKAHYPVEFMCSLLNNSCNKPDKLSIYLKDCYEMGIKVLSPTINGQADFSIQNNEIVFGLKGIKGLGSATIEQITKEQNLSFDDFITNIRPSSDTIVALAESGALDHYGYTRRQLIESVEFISQFMKNIITKKNQVKLFKIKRTIPIVNSPEYDFTTLAELEYERLGVYLKYNPLNNKDLLSYTPDYLEPDTIVKIGGYLRKIEERYTKNGKLMATGKLMTLIGEIDLLIFPQKYLHLKRGFKDKTYIVVEGLMNNKIIVEGIYHI